MKHFAEGYQYKVYDIGNNRVLKKTQPYFYTLSKVFAVARKQENASVFKALHIALKSNKENKRALETMKEKLKSIPRHFFANPQFTPNTLHFTQDKVTPIEHYLPTHSLEENKKIIDGYIALQKILWSYGIHDAVYKFQPNYGVTERGEVVCIDFGEFVFTKEEALKSLAKGKWFSRPSYKKWAEDDLKIYYTEKMKEVMTSVVLENSWNKK